MIPNFFKKAKIPKKLPKEFKKEIILLKKAKTKLECLKHAYKFLTKRYCGSKRYTYIRFHKLFDLNPYSITKRKNNKKKFLHCTTHNYLLRILLIRSGHFKESDIKWKWTTLYYISPHQYLKINVSNRKTINVDVWGNAYGIKFGDFSSGFKVNIFNI